MTALNHFAQTAQFRERSPADEEPPRPLNIEVLLNKRVDTGSSASGDESTPTLDLFSQSYLTFLSDGSSVSRPSSMTVKAWRLLPTSAGKSFEWEGVVTNINDDRFMARLQNVKGAEANFSEYVEFSVSDVPPGDRDLVKEGGIFRWVVGLEARSGTRQKYSKVVFRRLPAWTQRSHDNATNKLKEIMSGISWAEDESTE